MSSAKADSAIKAYGKVNVQANAEYATPHRLISMLIEGALDKISAAKGFMQRKEIENKGNYISWAISIIEGLRISLDGEKGGEIAANLESLYIYMEQRLVEANARNDESILDEVTGLLRTVQEAWMSLPQEIQNAPDVQKVGQQSPESTG